MDGNEVVDNVQDVDVEDTESDVDDVPAELHGLSEDVIKETMAEANGEEYVPDDDNDSAAEPASDNKQSTEPVFDRPNQKIPYERFKSEVDKNKNLKAELDKLRAEFDSYKAGAASNTPPPQQSAQRNPQPQEAIQPVQPQFSPDQIKAINDAIKNEAMQMSGLSQKEIDAIEYMDDDDERKVRYQFAEKMATQKVNNVIQQAQHENAVKRQKFLEYHNKVAAGYNAFVEEQMNDPDFESIKAYAVGDYFDRVSPDMQPIITDAYTRIERGHASPQDIAVVQRYFSDAKNDFKRGGRRNTNAANRTRQATAQPRAGQVEGSAAPVGTPSVAALERMLNEKSWDDIPDEYKAILKGL